MKGRKPKPTHLKLVSGTFRKHRAPKREPMPAGALTEPMWPMPPRLRALWDRALREAPAGLLKPLDASILTVWVVAADLHRQATEALAEHGAVLRGKNGEPMANPWCRIGTQQAAIMLKACAEMGFTPSSRGRVSIDPPPPPNPFDEFS